MTWNEGVTYCMNTYNSQPVSIIDASHNFAIYNMCNDQEGCWIGAFSGPRKCQNGQFNSINDWRTLNAPSVTYLNFNPLQPGRGCCGFMEPFQNGNWANEFCEVRKRVICPGLFFCVFFCEYNVTCMLFCVSFDT